MSSPPWLCPTTTIWRKAGSEPEGSKVAIASRRRLPQVRGRHRDRLARGVQEHPELVVIGQYGVVAQLVVRLGPSQRAGDQPVDEHHRDLPGLIGAKEVQALLEPPQVRGDDPGKGCTPQPPAAIHLHGQRRGPVRRERPRLAAGLDGPGVERVVQDERQRPPMPGPGGPRPARPQHGRRGRGDIPGEVAILGGTGVAIAVGRPQGDKGMPRPSDP